MQPGDIRSLDDIEQIPPFSVHDLRAFISDDRAKWQKLATEAKIVAQ